MKDWKKKGKTKDKSTIKKQTPTFSDNNPTPLPPLEIGINQCLSASKVEVESLKQMLSEKELQIKQESSMENRVGEKVKCDPTDVSKPNEPRIMSHTEAREIAHKKGIML